MRTVYWVSGYPAIQMLSPGESTGRSRSAGLSVARPRTDGAREARALRESGDTGEPRPGRVFSAFCELFRGTGGFGEDTQYDDILAGHRDVFLLFHVLEHLADHLP